jgi:hypothetical protein
MTDAIARRDSTATVDHREDAPTHTPPVPPRPQLQEVDWNAFGRSSGSPALDRHLDASLDMFVKNKNVMMLGMNETRITGPKQNDAEWGAVHDQAVASGVRAVHITASYSSVVVSNGHPYDLAAPGQCQAFARSLGIPSDETTRAIGDVLENAKAVSRDELARIAIQWSCAERPGTPAQHTVPSRFMVSGHCAPNSFYDGANDSDLRNEVFHEDIQALARAMPHASAQVRDVMFSACSTMKWEEKERAVEAWRSAFPHMESMQGYGSPVDYHSPTGDVAIAHERVWLSDTRSANGTPHLRREEQLSFASHTMIWTKARGFEEGK